MDPFHRNCLVWPIDTFSITKKIYPCVCISKFLFANSLASFNCPGYVCINFQLTSLSSLVDWRISLIKRIILFHSFLDPIIQYPSPFSYHECTKTLQDLGRIRFFEFHEKMFVRTKNLGFRVDKFQSLSSMSDIFNEALIRSHSPRTKLFLNTTQHGSVRNRSSTLSMFSPRPRAQQIERDAMIGARDSKTRFRPMTGWTQLVAFLFLHPLSFYSCSAYFGYACF